MRVIRLLGSSLILASLCLLAPPASSQSVAKTEFREAKKRFDDGQFEEALQMFQIAWEHSHSPNARLYVARSLDQLGNHKAAYDEYVGTVRDASEKAAEDEKYLQTRNVAAAELVLLETKIGRLLIVPDASVPNATVTIDGRPVPAIKIGEPLPLVPGRKTIVASAEGFDDLTFEVDLGGGEIVATAVSFPKGDGQVVVAPPPIATPAEEAPLTIMQIAGIGTMALGGATLVLAGVSGGAAASKFSAVKTACGGTRCTEAQFGDVVDSGKTFELLAYVGVGVGAAALLGGGAMFLWGGASEGPDQAAALAPLPGGAALRYELRF
jgi:hypothetical protein